jgi:hypothetical protein
MNIHHLHINTKNDQLNANNNYRVNLPSNRIVLDGDAYLQINNFFVLKTGTLYNKIIMINMLLVLMVLKLYIA